MNNACLETARQALTLNLCAYPAAGDTDAENPKRPFGEWRIYQQQPPTLDHLAELYSRNGLSTIGLICGAISNGLECLDFDTHDGYQQFRAEVMKSDLAPAFQRIESGYLERTPRGWHLLYYCVAAGRNEKLSALLKIETRGEGGYVVIAPSVFSDAGAAKQYRVASGGLDSIARITAAERDALHALIRNLGNLAPQASFPTSNLAQERIQEGNRNSMLASVAGAMRSKGMSGAAITAALYTENRERCEPPLPDAEVQAIARSIAKYPVGPSSQSPGPVNWQSPKELPSGIPAVLPLDPGQLLPPVLGEWVKDHAHRLQCPADYPAVGLIVALSSVIGGRLQIRPKQLDSWTVTPNLWGLVIGRPSTLKSPAMAAALAPLNELDAAAEVTYGAALTQYEAARMAYELVLGNTKKQAGKHGGAMLNTSQIAASMASMVQQQPTKPARQRFVVNDATVEKLGEILAENPHGVLLFRDELKGFLAELDGEDNATRRAFILQAWDGNGSYDFDRIGRGHIHIPRTILSVLGTTQPGVIEAYLATALRGGVGDDGLMQRFQLAVYPDEPDMPRLVDAPPNLQAATRVSVLYKKLAQLDPSSVGAQQDNLDGARYLRFTTEAQQRFDTWYLNLLRHMKRAGHAALESHYGKYRSLVPSLALIFHLAAEKTGLVGDDSLLLAIGWAGYLKSHAQRIYTYSIRGDALAARALGDAIKAGKLSDGFSLRDLQRKNWSGLSTRERCAQAIEILAERHWLAAVRSECNGKTIERCRINPALAAAG